MERRTSWPRADIGLFHQTRSTSRSLLSPAPAVPLYRSTKGWVAGDRDSQIAVNRHRDELEQKVLDALPTLKDLAPDLDWISPSQWGPPFDRSAASSHLSRWRNPLARAVPCPSGPDSSAG